MQKVLTAVMTTLHSALNFNFASSEASRLAFAERGAEEVVAAQLRQAAEQNKFAVGSTVTARYQYKVGPDGQLIPQQTQVTTDAPEDALRQQGRRGRQRANQDFADRQPSFRDLAKPHAELSPTEELALFAPAEQQLQANQSGQGTQAPILDQYAAAAPATTLAAAEVVDEDGEAVDAELLTKAPDAAPEAKRFSFLPSLQFTVAGLYARNNDVIYSATPLAQLAA